MKNYLLILLTIVLGYCLSITGCHKKDNNVTIITTIEYDTTKFKVIPSHPTISDSVYFSVYSQPFGGDCSYKMELDSIKNNNVYISGKYESQAKCMGEGINDTLNIGLFPVGSYFIIYSFIDTYDAHVPTRIDTVNYTVNKKGKML